MTVTLYRVILPVSDIEAAARFYAAILGESGRRVSTGRHYFGSGQQGAILACYDLVADGDRLGDGWRQHPSQYVYFSVADLEAARRECEAAGARQIASIEAQPWGETLFYARDPFGKPIAFVRQAPSSPASSGQFQSI